MIQNMPIALQLFSVRDELAADFRGTLQKVKDLGYEGVEFAGLHGRDPQEIRAMLDDIGLKGMSAHVPWTSCWPISTRWSRTTRRWAAGTSRCRGWTRRAARDSLATRRFSRISAPSGRPAPPRA